MIARKLWQSLVPSLAVPDDSQIFLWLRLHHLDVAAYGIEELAKKLRRTPGMTLDHALRFASRCMNNREQPGYSRKLSSCIKGSEASN